MIKIRVRQVYGDAHEPRYLVYVDNDFYATCTAERYLNDWLRRAWAHAQWHMGLTGTRGVE